MPADIRSVTAAFATAPQLEPQDMAEAAARGFALVINNRPDGEAPGQPTSAEMAAATKAAGLDYLYVPVRGAPGPSEVEAVRDAVASADGPVLAFCRSGTRSTLLWALARGRDGGDPAALAATAAAAGYDLSPIRSLIGRT